ncbi:hypothetical protein VQ03_11475 [Methylobacterium tarhaniae]|uniref:Uncharacterized protein n=1 Tax=Methylobacterium tarhaniae TaxID=1187852 RepID=A0A0J6VSF3_9HYPH|nr:hypothetical protein [Methylobacterium tarhaniae]KMO42166.1 hypothetical protein VQ03_11475 [Methylobacterium tarhaniae]
MRARPCARLPLLARLAVFLAALATAGAPLCAGAAPAVDKAPKAGAGTARDVAATASVTAPAAEADDAQCSTSRKKLFVDGEGWIVRRVTTCR